MVTEEDDKRHYEGRADIRAAVNPAAITDEPALQAALVHTRTRLVARRAELRAAVHANVRETGETERARIDRDTDALDANQQYRYVRGYVVHHLLNLPPEAAVRPAEVERRSRAANRLLPLRPSHFDRESPEKKLELLETAIKAVGEEPELRADLGPAADLLLERFQRVHDALEARVARVQDEVTDDRKATARLVAARQAFDRAHAAHTRQVEAALEDGGRIAEIGRYLKARDPAYRARRAAGRPVREEPDAGDLDAEVEVTEPEAPVPVEPVT